MTKIKPILLTIIIFSNILGEYNLPQDYRYLVNPTPEVRMSGEPYISGDAFRHYADHICDEIEIKIDPAKVYPGMTVFLPTHQMFTFFTKIHPKIKYPYILITHNGDFSSPGEFYSILDDPKLFHWFGVNPSIPSHPKFTGIPFGLPNAYCRRYNPESLPCYQNKSILCSMCFSLGTNYNLRKYAWDKLINKDFITAFNTCPLDKYFNNLSQSKFTISPPGRGTDCMRVWEALLVNCIPIVKSSSLDTLYKDLPILIINDWNDLTKNLLNDQYNTLNSRFSNLQKTKFKYWSELIQNLQLNCKKDYLNEIIKNLKAHSTDPLALDLNNDSLLNYLFYSDAKLVKKIIINIINTHQRKKLNNESLNMLNTMFHNCTNIDTLDNLI